uniref:ASXH domain-containing protein n=1 Tax=Panagrellus redivivus TaxID=6233 RepID=A0A7E4VNB1_PANRE
MSQPKRKPGEKPTSSGSTKAWSSTPNEKPKPKVSFTKMHEHHTKRDQKQDKKDAPGKGNPNLDQTRASAEVKMEQFINAKYGMSATASFINSWSDIEKHFEKLSAKEKDTQ